MMLDGKVWKCNQHGAEDWITYLIVCTVCVQSVYKLYTKCLVVCNDQLIFAKTFDKITNTYTPIQIQTFGSINCISYNFTF